MQVVGLFNPEMVFPMFGNPILKPMPLCTFYHQVLSYPWKEKINIFEHMVQLTSIIVLVNVLGLDRYLLEIMIMKVRIFTRLPAVGFLGLHYTLCTCPGYPYL